MSADPQPIRSLAAVLCLLIFAAATAPAQAEEPLRYDGVYRSDQVDNYWYYVRFYRNGTVITMSSTGGFNDIREYFGLGGNYVARGQWMRQGDRVVYNTRSKSGIVKYDGYVLSDGLSMDSESLINGFVKKGRRFYFKPLSFGVD